MRQFNKFNDYPFLKELQAHEALSQAAQEVWQSIAPDNLANLSQAIYADNQQLRIITPHNAVAAKIKLLTPSLLHTLNKQGYEVTAIHVKVQVKSTPQKKSKKPREISHHAASNLNALAEKLQGSPLGDALSKLAKKSS